MGNCCVFALLLLNMLWAEWVSLVTGAGAAACCGHQVASPLPGAGQAQGDGGGPTPGPRVPGGGAAQEIRGEEVGVWSCQGVCSQISKGTECFLQASFSTAMKCDWQPKTINKQAEPTPQSPSLVLAFTWLTVIIFLCCIVEGFLGFTVSAVRQANTMSHLLLQIMELAMWNMDNWTEALLDHLLVADAAAQLS